MMGHDARGAGSKATDAGDKNRGTMSGDGLSEASGQSSRRRHVPFLIIVYKPVQEKMYSSGRTSLGRGNCHETTLQGGANQYIPRGDARLPRGDARLPRGDARLPRGDARVPWGDARVPGGTKGTMHERGTERNQVVPGCGTYLETNVYKAAMSHLA